MDEQPIRRSGIKFLEQLPPGDWVMERIGDDTIIFACPEHEPRIAKNGKLEILKPLPRHMINF